MVEMHRNLTVTLMFVCFPLLYASGYNVKPGPLPSDPLSPPMLERLYRPPLKRWWARTTRKRTCKSIPLVAMVRLFHTGN